MTEAKWELLRAAIEEHRKVLLEHTRVYKKHMANVTATSRADVRTCEEAGESSWGKLRTLIARGTW